MTRRLILLGLGLVLLASGITYELDRDKSAAAVPEPPPAVEEAPPPPAE
jgi:hypothetical protein